MSTLEKGKPVSPPLRAYPHFTARAGNRALTVQVNLRQGGSFGVGILTDVTDAFAALHAAYQPRCEALALDLGLNILFAIVPATTSTASGARNSKYHDRCIKELAA
ncbi:MULTISPECIES: hypothetical protein [Caballeronia]|uniref:hypothetical protein n=1 Tax=Caballeronia TaxID=1827195 RepID=UPI001185D9C3|nr:MULTISPECIES: hypothetical protein [Caballeronia]MCE4546351.1 hypothetical protein [Caballeronia sp. PC1]MCE4573174.1 hypothetical protein [Caballeronia sp. CLC5]